MKRDLLVALMQWKTDPYRKPLILRGARQVGKTWLVMEFGKTYTHFIHINFEKNKAARQIFGEDIDLDHYLQLVSLEVGTPIIPGKTLLFLDEIQESSNAIKALRYFKEEKPDLHVIAAGSLLDFTLEQIGLPVGRVQFMYLYPLSFGEFLSALDYDELRNYIKTQQVNSIIHDKLINLLKNYMWLGGMPAVIESWKETGDPITSQRRQDEILEAYEQDFYKYTKTHEIPYVTQVFNNIPQQLGNKFMYSKVEPQVRSYLHNNALNLLVKAGIGIYCYHSSGQGIPLGANMNAKRFKVYFFDIGLAQRLLGLNVKTWLLNPIPLENQGEIAEQLVAQELLSYAPYHKRAQLFYWHREAKSSNAEVDFLWVKDGHVIPIEVKSNLKGSMKSLYLFLDSHPHSPYGLKISEGVFAQHNQLQEIPLYGLESWLSFDDISE